MTYGPIDFLALEFEGNQFKGEILPALLELVEKKIVRVIDLVIILKDSDGEIIVRELQQLDPETIAMFNPLQVEVTEMMTTEDIEMIGEQLADNSTAAIMLFENLWPVKFRDAVRNANGRLVMMERIPDDVVLEELDKMAQIKA